MSSPVSVTSIRLQSAEFFALGFDGLHGRETQGAEVRVQRIERAALIVLENRRAEDLLSEILDGG